VTQEQYAAQLDELRKRAEAAEREAETLRALIIDMCAAKVKRTNG